MEDPQGRSGLPTGVYGMLTSDHDTEKTSGEKYQRDKKRMIKFLLYHNVEKKCDEWEATHSK